MRLRLLGGLTPRDFLRGYWQKRPLFVRGAVPRFAGLGDEMSAARELFRLAARADVESRIVERRGRRRETRHGPFDEVVLKKSGSTLLVNGVNLHSAAADDLLQRFNFMPQARLDDVMVSYATPGGGVGPHVDRYDVFLLQGPGRRAWRLGGGSAAGQRFVVELGDLLYLPPGVRHDGVALDACFTYSIGFRAPRGAELGAAFLDWLHERGLPQAEYRDPGLAPAPRSAHIPEQMVEFAAKLLGRIRWSRRDVEEFMGKYLSEPKPHVVFQPGRSRRTLRHSLVRLDPKTRLLYRGARFFINGESFALNGTRAVRLRELADQRAAPGARLAGARLNGLISRWQRQGYVNLEKA